MSLIVADYCNWRYQLYKYCFFDVLCWFVWSWMNFIRGRRGFESRGFAMPTDLRLMKSSPATRCSASASLGTKSTGIVSLSASMNPCTFLLAFGCWGLKEIISVIPLWDLFRCVKAVCGHLQFDQCLMQNHLQFELLSPLLVYRIPFSTTVCFSQLSSKRHANRLPRLRIHGTYLLGKKYQNVTVDITYESYELSMRWVYDDDDDWWWWLVSWKNSEMVPFFAWEDS